MELCIATRLPLHDSKRYGMSSWRTHAGPDGAQDTTPGPCWLSVVTAMGKSRSGAEGDGAGPEATRMLSPDPDGLHLDPKQRCLSVPMVKADISL